MTDRSGSVTLVGAALSSAAVLMLEVVLTRVFAVTQFHHFGFVAVSLALLGFGASGSILYIWPRLGRGGPGRWATLAAAQAVATLGGYLVANLVPFDTFTVAWEPIQLVYLSLIYVALTTPFFFAGALVAVLLAGWDQPERIGAHQVYAANLVGAGLGAPLGLLAIDHLGGDLAVVATSALAALAAPVFVMAGARRRQAVPASVLLIVLLGAVVAAGPVVIPLRLSPYKELSAALRYPGASVLSTGWTPASRVDHISSEGIRSLPGLSLTYRGVPPPQNGVTVDGDDLRAIPLVGPEDAEFVPYLLSSLPYRLRPDARVAVLDAGGGLSVLTARRSGAETIVAVERDPLVVTAASSSPVYSDPAVEVVIEEPRTFVEKTTDSFDVVELALSSPFRPVTSGAYSLAEDYGLTVEAVSAYLDLLDPGGLFAMTRWLQTPPSEETRALALVAEALRRRDVDPADTAIALRSFSNVLILASPYGFSSSDLSRISSFAEELRFDLVAFPGMTADMSNRFNVLPEDNYFRLASMVLAASSPTRVFDTYEFDITPPTDDHPFFHHYFTPEQSDEALATLGRTWQPFGGAGFFVLVALLALSMAAAVLLIVVPVAVRTSRESGLGWTIGYFGLLGLAFLLVEIAMFQRYILVLGRATTALAVVLASVLVFSGVGSRVSTRLRWLPTALTLTAVAAFQPLVVRAVISLGLGWPLWARASTVVLSVAPVALLMGTMFPKGLARIEAKAPQLIPWAWGINGATSVIAAIAAALGALAWGFTAVMVLGALCYAAATVLVFFEIRPRRGLTHRPAVG